MTIFDSRLPKPLPSNLQLDRSAAKPLSKQIFMKQKHAQSLFGFDKSNILDLAIKPLNYTVGFNQEIIQKFYVFYKKASRDKVLKISVSPYQIMTNANPSWNIPYSLFVDINELTVLVNPTDLLWANEAKGITPWFKSNLPAEDRLFVPTNGMDMPNQIEDYINVSDWTTNQIYCFEILVKSYGVEGILGPPFIIGLGHIHFSVSPEDKGKYFEETYISDNSLFVGEEIVESRTETLDSSISGIRKVVEEINKVKNSSFDHAQALFQFLPYSSTWTQEAGFETYLIPQENSSFTSPASIPLISLNTPRLQKGRNGGNKTFTFCMKYIAPVSEPTNHPFELEYRKYLKSGPPSPWQSLKIFQVPDNNSIFIEDFNIPAPFGADSIASCILDFRILTTDTSNPFIVQNISIIEKEY
jgi:hypothetical protein